MLEMEPVDTTDADISDTELENFVNQYEDQTYLYTWNRKIGEGKFGEVFMASDEDEGRYVIKKLKDVKKNYRVITREIEILQKLEHKNVIQLQEVCEWGFMDLANQTLSFVFEVCCHDLRGLMMKEKEESLGFSVDEKASIIKQMLEGVEYIHSKHIIHRDFKPEHILFNEAGIVKVTDFGAARHHTEQSEEEPNQYTPGLFGLSYKPPEVALGDRNYDFAADMWSVGCIVAELMREQPLFPAQNPNLSFEEGMVSLMYEIVQICGPISDDLWPGVSLLPEFISLARQEPRIKNKGFKNSFRSAAAFDLFSELVALNPTYRLDAASAAVHPFCPKEPMSLQDTLAKLDGRQLHWVLVNKKNEAAKKLPGKNAQLSSKTSKVCR